MEKVRAMRYVFAAIVMAVSVVLPLLPVRTAHAADLAGETFNGISTPSNAWVSGGSGTVACLTAATVNASNSIPACADGPLDTVGNGVLRLTAADNSVAGFAIYNTPISAGDGLDIQFNMYQWGGTSADGISFFLIDGAANPTVPGAFGGSLGYASSDVTAGIVGGYVGVGFDRFGNYSNANVGGGGPGPVANSIGVRGSEDAGDGYEYITGTPANGSLDGDTREDSMRRVKINISTANVMSVSVDYGSGFEQELSGIDLNAINGEDSMPASFKFGFAASTGGSNNNHEISGLTVGTNPPSVSLGMATSSPRVQGGQVTFTLNGSNSASAEATTDDITIVQTLPTGFTPASATGTGWDCDIAGQVVTCTRPGDDVNALDPGETTPNITVVADISLNAGTPLSVSAELTTDNNDPLANTQRTQNNSVLSGSYLDDDGIFNAEEAAAPNGGDANNDGDADSEQNNVTSLVNDLTGKYITLESAGDCAEGNGGVTSDTEAANTTADANYLYPAGMLSFELECADPGDTATVTLYYFGNYDSTALVARKYNDLTGIYQTISGAVLSNVTIGGQAALRIVYDITDGGPLDQDGLADGAITDPAGPAVLAASVTAPTSTVGTPNTGLQTRSMAIYYIAALAGATLLGYELVRLRRTKAAVAIISR